MAKLKSFIKLQGTLDGLTFYKSKDGYLIRTKGGVSKSRILKDPNFKRTRENMHQFGLNATAGKLLRTCVGPILMKAKDSKLSSRMLKLMNEIKRFDTVSVRGEQLVGLGLTSSEGKQLLTNFNFNIDAPLFQVLNTPFTIDTTSGAVSISNFIPEEHLKIPSGATHVEFQSVLVNVNFDTQLFNYSYSSAYKLPIDLTETSFELAPSIIQSTDGIQLNLLLVAFYQKVNTQYYSLYDGIYNSLAVVAVV